METYTINVRSLPKVHQIGQKIYVIKPSNYRNVQTKCPICDDKKHISYRDYEFPCPYCTQNYGARRNDKIIRNSIPLFDYEIEEFIVYRVEIKGPDTMTAYRPKNREEAVNLPKLWAVTAFHRDGNSYRDLRTFDVPEGINLDPDEDRVLHVTEVRQFAFTTKQKAQEAVAVLVDREKKRLAEFNEKYGCDFKYEEG